MTSQITLFILCFIIGYCLAFEQFNSIVFRSDEIIPKILNNSNSHLVKNHMCNALYENMVENEFVCVYPNNTYQLENNFTPESKFVFDSVKIVVETFFDKDSIENFASTNKKDFNIIYSNYLSFYIGSIIPINNIIENLLKYLTNKFVQTYNKFKNFLQDKYSLDEERELIILPIPSKIRYFTDETLSKYDGCLDFLNSLENSICFTTQIKNIQKLNKFV
jgi:hypothetical protein